MWKNEVDAIIHMTEFIVLTLVYWALPIIVILKDFIWDLYLWEVRNYKVRRFVEYIRWDRDELRAKYLTSIKFVLFIILALQISDPIITVFCAFLVYAIWFIEVLNFLRQVLFERFLTPTLNLRNIVILGLFAAFISALLSLLIIPFLVIRGVTSGVPVIQTIDGEAVIRYFDVYLFLGLSALLGLILDLGSTLLTLIFVILSKPISFLEKEYIKNRLKKLQSRNIILILGNEFLDTTSEYIAHAVEHSGKTTFNSKLTLRNWREIYNILPKIKESEYIIFKVSTSETYEIQSILNLIQPKFVMLMPNLRIKRPGLIDRDQINLPNYTKLIRNSKQAKLFVPEPTHQTFEYSFDLGEYSFNEIITRPSKQLLQVLEIQVPKNEKFDLRSDAEVTVNAQGVTTYRFVQEPNKLLIDKVYRKFIEENTTEKMILVTDGIKGLKKEKFVKYANIKQYLKIFKVIITSDHKLFDTLLLDNTEGEYYFSDSIPEVNYLLAKSASKGDIVFLEGKFAQLITY